MSQVTPVQYLLDLKMASGASLLAGTNMPVSRIIREMGRTPSTSDSSGNTACPPTNTGKPGMPTTRFAIPVANKI